jgi:hypothetical protein
MKPPIQLFYLISNAKQVLALTDSSHSFIATLTNDKQQQRKMTKIKWYYRDGKATHGHRTICGYRRRNVFILLGVILALLALIIGLAVGLTLRNRSSEPYFPV